MEKLFILVWKMRQDIEFQKSRSTLQALLSQKGAEDKTILSAFEDLREAFFPFDKNQKTDEIRRLKDAMIKEITRGPLSITVLDDPNRRKVASRLVKGRESLAAKDAATRIGQLRQIDPFNKSRNRRRSG